MPRIRLLDQGTVNKIAAGEVVERPASVVKEMVENAIDAGASKVTVEIKGGGISLIRITDNGCGIPEDQVRTAFLRHSTSKIRRVEDLQNTISLGFRGEALASIAAVARVEMLTKPKDQMTGIRFVIEGGEEKVFEEVACPAGTTILVENLFFNTPPRRKFLKKENAEAAAVTDLMQKLTLAHPEVSIRYLNGKKEPTIYSSGNGNVKNSIYAVYGRDIVDKLIPVESEMVRGYISRPQLTKINRTFENFFINGRYVRSSLLEKALDEAYKDYIVPGTFPVAVLHLTLDPATLDVNVHPTKMEIRFHQEEELRTELYTILAETLKQENLISRLGDFYQDAPMAEKEIVLPGQAAAAATDVAGESAGAPSGNRYIQEGVRQPFLPQQGKSGAAWGQDNPWNNGHKPKGARITTDYTTEWKSDRTLNKNGQKPYTGPLSKAFIVEEDIGEYRINPEASAVIATPLTGEQMGIAAGDRSPNSHGAGNVTAGGVSGTLGAPETAPGQGIPAREGNIRIHEEITVAPAVTISETPVTTTNEKTLPHELRLVGQLFKTYWIAEEGDVFYIVDQHAAHERVLYDRYRELLNRGEIDTQMLMEPVVASCHPRAIVELDSFQPVLTKLGYRVEAFGDDAVIVRGVPFLFNHALPAEDITKMLDMLQDGQVDTARDLLIDKIAMMSCKAAVKGNDAMSFMEAESLLQQLFASANPYNCPHGRPTILSVTQYQLEKRFKRV